MDVQTFLDNWPVILTLLGGLLVIKALVLTPVAKVGGNLSWADSVRLGILLSQGGEFAFVLLALANSLGVLNSQLNNVLLIVVVLSMALTPTLADGAKWASELVGGLAQGSAKPARDGASLDVLTQLEEKAFAQEPVVICGVGPVGMVVASMLTSPLSEADIFMQTAPGMRDAGLPPFVMLDYNVRRLRAAQGMGLKTVYYKGYAGRDILEAIGVERPTAVVVCYGNRAQSVETVKSVKSFHPGVPVLASAQNAAHAAELREVRGSSWVVLRDVRGPLTFMGGAEKRGRAASGWPLSPMCIRRCQPRSCGSRRLARTTWWSCPSTRASSWATACCWVWASRETR